MLRGRRLILAAASLALCLAGAVTVMPAAQAAPLVQLCTFQNSDHCMNRAGGGTGNGTHAIVYHQDDSHNDFTLVQLSGFVCGLYGTVHNGENGCVGPFTNGSGLNARYDGKTVVQVYAYNEARCVSIPSFGSGLTTIQDCGANGYAYVQSPVGGQDYLISVGESNYQYGLGGGSNHPYWLDDAGFQTQMVANASAQTTWGCVGGGIGLC